MTDSLVDCRLETERTALSRLTAADAPALFRTVGDPAVMRYWFPGPDGEATQTAERIAEIERHWQTHGFGDWGVTDKRDAALIGFAGLHHIADMDEVNIGYVLARDRWRQGLGSELARAILRFGFVDLCLPEIVTVVDPANTASIHLAGTCGLALRRRFTWMGCERLVYGISLQEWQATHSEGSR